MDDAAQFLPRYLRFVKGIIDASDLPLNVSREILQDNKQVESIRAASTKRVLSMLEKLNTENPDKYQDFWNEFELYAADLVVGTVVNVALVGMLAPYARIGRPSISKGLLGRMQQAYAALPSRFLNHFTTISSVYWYFMIDCMNTWKYTLVSQILIPDHE